MIDSAEALVQRHHARHGSDGTALLAKLRATHTRIEARTWDRFQELHATVGVAARTAIGEPAIVTCRFTHVYPDGPAPYFTVLAPARRGSEVKQWDEVKAAVSEALIAAGGTITHHHAVGRDHAPWMAAEVGELGLEVLRALKDRCDPAGIMNPGKLL